jgi:hypothetical protein
MNDRGMTTIAHSFALFSLVFAAAGCGDDAGGTAEKATLEILLEAEDTITDGLEAGDGLEQIRDGWAVSFDKYIAVIGDIDIASSTDESKEYEAAGSFAFDLTQVGASGVPLWTIADLPAGDYEFGYHLGNASEDAERDGSVSKADFEQMVNQEWTYLIEGTINQSKGQSCPPENLAEVGNARPNGNMNGRGEPCYDHPAVSFRIGVAAQTVFGPCDVDDMSGFNIPAGGTKTVAVTLHGDHLFFNGFPERDEGGIKRRAQWLADCDLNLDGHVSVEELEAIAPADLAEFDEGYQFGGEPIELFTVLDYATAQLKTQGHFQGEGSCPVDRMEHDHGH